MKTIENRLNNLGAQSGEIMVGVFITEIVSNVGTIPSSYDDVQRKPNEGYFALRKLRTYACEANME